MHFRAKFSHVFRCIQSIGGGGRPLAPLDPPLIMSISGHKIGVVVLYKMTVLD